MRKHAREKHVGKIPDYVMDVTGIFGDDAMLRQITESVLIRNTPGEKLKPCLNGSNIVWPTSSNIAEIMAQTASFSNIFVKIRFRV